MDEPNLQLPESFDASDGLSVVSTFAPELLPARGSLLWPWITWFLVMLVGAGLAMGPSFSQSVVVTVTLFVASVGAAWATTELDLRVRRGRFEQALEERPYEIYEEVVRVFRASIDEHRQRLLSPDTEWQRARFALREAAEEAKRSLTYWTNRLARDHTSELARNHRETARALHQKLADALAELDRREDALLHFFGRCEEKIRRIEQSRDDHLESARLAQLTTRSDDLVVDAALAIEEIGRAFAADAVRVGQALGALNRLQLKDSAGEVRPETVEKVAERILEAAEEEERALSELLSQVGP